MKILIACEFSGTVRDAFLRKGADAYSCDLLPDDSTNGLATGRHYQQDILNILSIDKWDLIIAHPPCTALAVSGNAHYGKDMPKQQERLDSIEWTMDLWHLMLDHSDRVCMENPVGVLPIKPTQYIQPYEHGHPESKKTGLWLDNLPKLQPSHDVKAEHDTLPRNERMRLHYLPPSKNRWKIRSKTFSGIANAMADQWILGI
jgi:hypothetical protein